MSITESPLRSYLGKRKEGADEFNEGERGDRYRCRDETIVIIFDVDFLCVEPSRRGGVVCLPGGNSTEIISQESRPTSKTDKPLGSLYVRRKWYTVSQRRNKFDK